MLSPRCRRLPLIGTLLALIAHPLAAQSGSAVSLRIRPRVGDTMYTRFEQDVEMEGTTRVGGADTTMAMRSNMLMLSHVLVQGSDDRATTVLTVTDSVAMAASGASTVIPPESVRRALQGKRVRLRIATNGSATVLDAPDELSPDLQAVVSGMPSTLPDKPIVVGATWERVMAIPVAGQTDAHNGATLRTTYRLDSLSDNGEIAHISMRGTLTRDSTAAALPQGLKVTSTGSITGSMQVDRKRGWWSDSRATITVKSTLTPPVGAKAQPMRVHMKITQRMRTADTP